MLIPLIDAGGAVPSFPCVGATLEELRVCGEWASDTIFAYMQTTLSVRIMNDMRVSTILLVTPELFWLGDLWVSWHLIYLCQRIYLLLHHTDLILFCLLGPTVYVLYTPL